MIEDKKDDEIIDVKEELDGSAVIELPDSIPSPDVKEVDAKKAQVDSD